MKLICPETMAIRMMPTIEAAMRQPIVLRRLLGFLGGQMIGGSFCGTVRTVPSPAPGRGTGDGGIGGIEGGKPGNGAAGDGMGPVRMVASPETEAGSGSACTGCILR